MNTRRQTIWLVTMLSIMVVLSAYYLFTYDEEDLLGANANDAAHEQWIDLDAREVDINDYDINDDVLYLGDGYTEAEYGDLADILSQIESQQASTSHKFDALHLQREDEMRAEVDRWMAVAASGSIEEQVTAQEKIYELSDTMAKVTHLEDMIRRDFPDAIIDQTDRQWRVQVNTDHMEKSQAVSIMNMVMKEMGATVDQVVVEMNP